MRREIFEDWGVFLGGNLVGNTACNQMRTPVIRPKGGDLKSFPISDAGPIEHGQPLPGQADVVVIGGSVIGVTTALFLALDGLDVVLLERGRIAGEQSSCNWGWIRVQGRDQDEIPIAQVAQTVWQDLAPQVGTDIGLKQTGVAYVANSDKDIAEFKAFMYLVKSAGMSTRLLDQKCTVALFPNVIVSWKAALRTDTDMGPKPIWRCLLWRVLRLNTARVSPRIVWWVGWSF